MATLKLTRNYEFANLFREYQIFVDGINIGSLGFGQTKEFEINPGHHTLTTKIDWCGSNEISFDIDRYETKSFNAACFKNCSLLMLSIVILGILNIEITYPYPQEIELLLLLIYPLSFVMLYYATLGRNKFLRLKELISENNGIQI